MQWGTKYLLLAIMLFSFAVFAPLPATADDGITVIMNDAYYADADNDGAFDDVVVKFEVIPPYGDSSEEYVIDLYCKLILPSGATHIYECAIVTNQGCEVTQYWYDAASESGWYEYSVYGYIFDSDVDSGYDEIIFDPPGGETGDPVVDTVIVEQSNEM